MKFAHVLALSCLVALAALPAQATVITTEVPLVHGGLSSGLDSGWKAVFSSDQAVKGITDIVVTADTVTISISKDFVGYDQSEDAFPIGKVAFIQTSTNDELTVKHIIVHEETIQNNTALPWTAFKWNLDPTGVAKFDTGSSWDVSPFTSKTWINQVGSTANELLAFNGIVPAAPSLFSTFSPNGSLVIDIDLSLSASPTTFELKETVVPEPGTISLLALASLGWFRRRRSMPLGR